MIGSLADTIRGNVETREVFINEARLDPAASQVLKNHSPDGFAWGYSGSGPSQLALAILLFYVGKEKALRHYQEFKFDVIAGLEGNFELSSEIVKDWIVRNVKNDPL